MVPPPLLLIVFGAPSVTNTISFGTERAGEAVVKTFFAEMSASCQLVRPVDV